MGFIDIEYVVKGKCSAGMVVYEFTSLEWAKPYNDLATRSKTAQCCTNTVWIASKEWLQCLAEFQTSSWRSS